MERIVLWTVLVLVVAGAFGCGGASSRPAEPLYEPNYVYTAPSAGAGERIDVTVGLIAPQFAGDGEAYWSQNKGDEVVAGMVRALRTSFESLLVAKGFNTAGPFEALSDMTFPEKKGCDFVLYPLIDIAEGYTITNQRAVDEGNFLTGSDIQMRCDVNLRPTGAIQIVAAEPLSKERMWVKRITVAPEGRVFQGHGAVCQMQAATREIRNAWAQIHEEMYADVMKALDRYVSAEEFQMLKRQSQELREKKAY